MVISGRSRPGAKGGGRVLIFLPAFPPAAIFFSENGGGGGRAAQGSLLDLPPMITNETSTKYTETMYG